MEHFLSPTGVAVLLLLAFVVDMLRVGPNAFSDRVAFCMALVAIREGFNGSPLDTWTVGFVTNLIQKGLDATGGAYIAAASAQAILSAAVGVFAIYTVGVLLPVKASAKLGRFAQLSWTRAETSRINRPLWVAAFVLGLFSDLPGGIVGDVLTWAITLLAQTMTWIPITLFGVS